MIVVTCCNHGGGIYEVHEVGSELITKKVSDLDTRGIVFQNGITFAVTGSRDEINKQRGITVYDKHWDPLAHLPLNADLHGAVINSGVLEVIDSETDTLIKVDMKSLKEIDRFRLARPPDGPRQHYNDITIFRGQRVCSAFGSLPAAKNGGFIEIAHRHFIGELTQPHSVQTFGKWIWWCGSLAGTVMAQDLVESGQRVQVAIMPGYTRGLLIEEDHIWVGVSAPGQRTAGIPEKSIRHTGALVRIDKTAKTAIEIPIESPEVYAVARNE